MDVENILAKASDHLSVRRAFGAAYEKDGMLIIPVALVAGGGGGGAGRPRHQHESSAARPDEPAAPDAVPQESERMDAGGGFGGLVMPTGAYVVQGDRVRWVPAVDPTILVLAALSAVKVLSRVRNRRRRIRGRP